MTLMTKLATAAAAAALLSFSTPAYAQGKRASKAKTTTLSKVKKSKAKKTKAETTKRPKTKDYDFMADEIDGDRVLPNLDRVIGLSDSKHASLIRLREHFIPEILRSADML